MKFKYKKYSATVFRPIIPIEIIHNNIEIPYEVLVDSGADMCIFDSQIADILGLDILKGEQQTVTGVTGIPEYYYVHKIKIKVGGWEYKIDAGFMKLRNSAFGIVGQNGFFNLFTIKFDFQKGEIELKQK